ncbi:MAG: hypothetical protein IIA54_05615 [Chloroflexi bacterium]|nr:hypothetical protein [Chloroflexota bacterium]
MAKLDPAILAHLEWIGFVRPTGLVVSAPALVRAGAILDRRDAEGQRALRACAEEREFDLKEGPVPYLPDFRAFAESVLGWSFSPKGYAGTAESPIPPELEVPLPDYGETLRPDLAVRELEPKDGASPWQLLVRVLEPGEDFDRVVRGHGRLEASAHGRMERLLRQTGVPAGLLFNGRALRLLSAPRGESSGWLDFRVTDMVQTGGRPISTAMRLLLGETRLLAMGRDRRLAALLENSRKFQNEVSERLAEQVLHALYELLRGFQAAHDASEGELLRQPLAEHPDEVYRALLTVILRLVFLLYAEERDMLPEDETFLRYYSLAGLYERLREDAALFPDTMDQRYGAWAQLLVLFRMVYDGAESGAMRLPKRHGVLFDPDRFKFLEGRPSGGARQVDGFRFGLRRLRRSRRRRRYRGRRGRGDAGFELGSGHILGRNRRLVVGGPEGRRLIQRRTPRQDHRQGKAYRTRETQRHFPPRGGPTHALKRLSYHSVAQAANPSASDRRGI